MYGRTVCISYRLKGCFYPAVFVNTRHLEHDDGDGGDVVHLGQVPWLPADQMSRVRTLPQVSTGLTDSKVILCADDVVSLLSCTTCCHGNAISQSSRHLSAGDVTLLILPSFSFALCHWMGWYWHCCMMAWLMHCATGWHGIAIALCHWARWHCYSPMVPQPHGAPRCPSPRWFSSTPIP